MHQGEHEIRVGGDESQNQFTERIERDCIIISYIGLENDQIVSQWGGRETYNMMVNNHEFN